METREYTVWKFEEASPELQEKILNNYRDFNVEDSFWYEHLFDTFKTAGKLIGINISNIYFSGFWNQGDGACFEGEYRYQKGGLKALKKEFPQWKKLHSIAERLQNEQRINFYKLIANIEHSGHYNHEMCTNITVETDNYREWYSGPEPSYVEEIKDCLRDFMREIYRSLEKEYEYQTSDEAIKDSLIANEYQFNEEGRID